jgi:protein-L-isoaspartate(D-aspartate) O-methyltransferase
MGSAGPELRTFYARYVTARGGARDPRIEQAFAAVPREPFAGPGPWSISVSGAGYVQTPDDDPAYLYQDTLIALDAEKGINIGEPSLHARCLDALALKEGSTVLHVGAGSGYYTAILAQLVGPSGRVHAYEIEPALAVRAVRHLAHLSWVTVHARSGIADGLPQADAIYVNASITQPSWTWLDALRPGGRLMFPLHARGGFGGMLRVERPGSGMVWPARFVSQAGFIACQGRQDDAAGRRLTTAFARRDLHAVQSLRLDDAPDATCWYAGDDWWLSTDAPKR